MTTIERPGVPRLLATAVTLALISSGCGAGADPPKDASRQTALRFLEELKAGRIEAAWQGTSTEFKSLMGLGALKDFVKTHPALKGPVESADMEKVEREGHVMAKCRFHGSAKVKGKSVPATIDVFVGSSDGGEWKVEKVSVE